MQKSSEKSSERKPGADANKDKTVNVRFTFDDYSLVIEKARKSGLTVSEWIRRTATKAPAKRARTTPEINRYAYLDLSTSLLEFSELLKLIKKDEKFEDLRGGVVERTLVKIVSQIFEVKKKLL